MNCYKGDIIDNESTFFFTYAIELIDNESTN